MEAGSIFFSFDGLPRPVIPTVYPHLTGSLPTSYGKLVKVYPHLTGIWGFSTHILREFGGAL